MKSAKVELCRAKLVLVVGVLALLALPVLVPGVVTQGYAAEGGEFIWVALGDSVTKGEADETGEGGYVGVLKKKIQEFYPDATFENLAGGTSRCREIVEEPLPGEERSALEKAVAIKPDLVTLLVGANDITDRIWNDPERKGDFDLDEFEECFEDILKKLEKETEADIVIGNIPDLTRMPIAQSWSADKREEISERIEEANDAIEEIAEDSDAEVVDFFGFDALYAEENWSDDGIHPNHKGHALIADRWWEVLETMF